MVAVVTGVPKSHQRQKAFMTGQDCQTPGNKNAEQKGKAPQLFGPRKT
jgi:hypothetical protein